MLRPADDRCRCRVAGTLSFARDRGDARRGRRVSRPTDCKLPRLGNDRGLAAGLGYDDHPTTTATMIVSELSTPVAAPPSAGALPRRVLHVMNSASGGAALSTLE